MYIPSNFSIAEVIRYSEMPEHIRARLYEVLESIKEVQANLEDAEKRIELLEESVYERDVFIKDVFLLCKSTTKHKDLVTRIKVCFEESNIEL